MLDESGLANVDQKIEALKTQNEVIKEVVSEIEPNANPLAVLYPTIKVGYGINAEGNYGKGDIRAASPEYLNLKCQIMVHIRDGWNFAYNTYTDNNESLYNSGWRTNSTIVPKARIRIGFRKADDSKFTLEEAKQIITKVEFLNDSLIESSITKNQFITYSGYLTDKGGVANASEVNKEIYTDKIAVLPNSNIVLSLSYNKGHEMWFALCTYDKYGNFLERKVLIQGNKRTYADGIHLLNNNVYYVALSYRTYDDIKEVYIKSIPTVDSMASIVEVYAKSDNTQLNPFVNATNHRGYCTVAPENTLSAYKLSKKQGFDRVETDISFTSDGVAVCLHDETIDRTSNGTGAINNMTLEEVKQYDFGSWKSSNYEGEKIPTLEEFILLCRDLGLHPYIELKSGTREQIESCVDIVKAYGMLRNVSWISFSKSCLGYVKDKDNYARLGYTTSDITNDTITNATALKTDSNEVFINVQHTNATKEKVALCIANDFPLEVWTVNSRDAILKLDPYITGIASDNLNAKTILVNKHI